jgi:hypothetical protein
MKNKRNSSRTLLQFDEDHYSFEAKEENDLVVGF